MNGIEQWEKQAALKFARIYGVVHDLDLLRAEVKKYSWDYVYFDDFEGMYILIRDGKKRDHYQQILRQVLVENRSSGKSAHAIAMLRKRVAANFHLVAYESADLDALMEFDLGEGILKVNGGIHVTNAWLYVMRDTDNTVAFVDNKTKPSTSSPGNTAQHTQYHAAVLSWSDTSTLLRGIENLSELCP